jgi:hypothetical protein
LAPCLKQGTGHVTAVREIAAQRRHHERRQGDEFLILPALAQNYRLLDVYGRVVSIVASNAAPLMHPRIRTSIEKTRFPPHFRSLNEGPLP